MEICLEHVQCRVVLSYLCAVDDFASLSPRVDRLIDIGSFRRLVIASRMD